MMSAAVLLIYAYFRLNRRKYSQRCRRFVWAAAMICLCLPFELLPSIVTLSVPHAGEPMYVTEPSDTAQDNQLNASVQPPVNLPQPHTDTDIIRDNDLPEYNHTQDRAQTQNLGKQYTPDVFALILSIIFIGWAACAVA